MYTQGYQRVRFTLITVLLLIGTMMFAACGSQGDPNDPQSIPSPTPPVFIKEGDPMSCSDGYRIGIQETTLVQPGTDPDTLYSVSGVRIENGIQYAHISGGNNNSGISADLAVGQSITHVGVGTFTLLSVSLEGKDPSVPGAGGTASFCFEPTPGFEINPDIK